MPFADYLAARGARAARSRGGCTALRPRAYRGPLDDALAFARELLAPALVAAETLAEATEVQFPGLAGVLPSGGGWSRTTGASPSSCATTSRPTGRGRCVTADVRPLRRVRHVPLGRPGPGLACACWPTASSATGRRRPGRASPTRFSCSFKNPRADWLAEWTRLGDRGSGRPGIGRRSRSWRLQARARSSSARSGPRARRVSGPCKGADHGPGASRAVRQGRSPEPARVRDPGSRAGRPCGGDGADMSTVASFGAMGCEVVVAGASPEELSRIRALFEERDRVFSRFREESELRRVNQVPRGDRRLAALRADARAGAVGLRDHRAARRPHARRGDRGRGLRPRLPRCHRVVLRRRPGPSRAARRSRPPWPRRTSAARRSTRSERRRQGASRSTTRSRASQDRASSWPRRPRLGSGRRRAAGGATCDRSGAGSPRAAAPVAAGFAAARSSII